MPTLLEIEDAVRRSLIEGDDAALKDIVPAGLPAEARLHVYRNTFLGTLTKALRLSFPAVERLVGEDFFESAARIFIESNPPQSAWLDEYGAAFPRFLANFPPAAGLAYLPGVARLEWAVSQALHAPDAVPLDVSRLAAVPPSAQGRIVFAPHPALGLLRADHPVDEIWRAVLAGDDAAMSGIDADSGAVRLLVRRTATGVQLTRLTEPAWRFVDALCAGHPLEAALDEAPGFDAPALLSELLADGLFVDFEFHDRNGPNRPKETLTCTPP